MIIFRAISVVGLIAAWVTPIIAADDWSVWTETKTVRLLRDAPPQTQREVHLQAAKNEWESFQIFVRASNGKSAVRVRAGDLKGPGGHVLPARDVRLFREHALELAQGTYRNESFQPGWYPDPLIPDRHPLTGKPLREGRFRAFPFDLPPKQTHGIWIDIHVPPETPAGKYQGVYQMIAQDTEPVSIPVELTVWDFTLPRVAALRTALGSPAARMRSYYRQRAGQGIEPEPSDWEAVERQCAELVSRHRINATPPASLLTLAEQPDGSFRLTDDQLQQLRQFVGEFHVNAIQVPRPTGIARDPVAEQERLRAWLSGWNSVPGALGRPDIVFYTYLRDEPNDEEAYRFVQTWGRAIREAKSVVKVLVVEQTWSQNDDWGDLYGAVDIWCPLFSLFREESARRRQQAGETIWTYTALCQGEPTPWWHIDYPLLHYRVPAWTAWHYRIRGLLYWGGMSFWQAVDDPWTDGATYPRPDQRSGGRVYNGEGTLVYPGRAVGYEGIAPSLRLKTLRDAIEDYDYLALLEERGQSAKAAPIVQRLVQSWFQWEKDPAAYEAARAALAELLERHP